MTTATIKPNGPYVCSGDLEVAGKAMPQAALCRCGTSRNKPFCDGSHKGSEFNPVKYTAAESKAVYFCGCKHSGNGALCDGSHKSL